MKIFPYLLISAFMILSCSDTVKSKMPKTRDKIKSISEYTIERRLLSSYFNVGANLENHDKVGELDTMSVKRIIYPHKTVFIYTNTYDSDTLTYYRDSTYTYSSKKFRLLGEKTFVFKGSKVKVLKFYSEPIYRRPITTGASHIDNIYLNDSIGILLYQANSTWHAFREYDTRYSDLHKAMIRDTIFFEFAVPK
ncbi:hypothetical protein AAEO56_09925 [Flavobacterium sp. DGU11]|uniref:Lipoprotein n=1 Tax=Flavobacterium arundinis TaxID=3139143 RepID=A0ABU9HWN1_9FLAO